MQQRYLLILLAIIIPLGACGKGPKKIAYSTPEASVAGFFNAVATGQFDKAWISLSKRSQDSLVANVAKEEKVSLDKVRAMFDTNAAPIVNGFWKAFKSDSKISDAIPNAKYQLLGTTGNEAIVNFTTGNGAVIPCKAFKEADGWKFGYAESFGI